MPVAAGAATVLAVGIPRAAMGILREVLAGEAILPPESTSFADAPAQVRRLRPQVVLVGFHQGQEPALELGSRLFNEHQGIHLVAIDREGSAETIRRAMRAGFREFVVLPGDEELLVQAIREASQAIQEDEDRAEVVAVMGASGGVGVTTLAANLGADLAATHRVLAVDMDFSTGDLAAFLDLRPSSHIVDLLRDMDRLDERLLAGSVAVHPSGLHVLAQPQRVEEHEVVAGDTVLTLLNLFARVYQFVVLDCGSRVDEAILTAATAADRLVLVCTPMVHTVRNAWRRLELLADLGVEPERVAVVVNRFEKRRAGLGVDVIESTLRRKVAAILPADPRTVDQAVNDGRLIREVNRRSPVVEGMEQIVGVLMGEEPQPANSSLGRNLMNLLFS